MRPLWRTALGLAVGSAAIVGTLVTGTTGASAATSATNVVGFANLAMTQMLTRGPGNAAVTADAAGGQDQIWDQVYQVQLPTQEGMSSPYVLRAHGTNLCLQDLGEGLGVTAVACESNPAEGSAQLWQIHRTIDRTVDNRDYYYQINRASGRVLSAQPTSVDASITRVVSARAEPVSRSGAADAQLWVMLAA